MEKILRLAQLCAYISVVVLSSVVVFTLLRSHEVRTSSGQTIDSATPLANPTKPSPSSREEVNGKVVPLHGVDWEANGTTLVMYISTGCHFCQESTPFYQRLTAVKGHGKVKLIAVLPQSVEESTKYLHEHGIKVDQVLSASLTSIGVTATPTLMMVSENGVVFDSWRGKLNDDRQNELLAKLAKVPLSS
jgi:hypothetical protein